jgi:hypothetical protein
MRVIKVDSPRGVLAMMQSVSHPEAVDQIMVLLNRIIF